MVDERQDSIRKGMGVPPESAVGQEAAREKQEHDAHMPPIGGGMGGTSDAETAPQERDMEQAIHEAEARRRSAT